MRVEGHQEAGRRGQEEELREERAEATEEREKEGFLSLLT